jgi:general secretion pathway protein L
VSSAIFAWPYLPGLTENCVVSDGAALAVITQGRLSYVRAFDDGDPVKSLSATLSALELSGDGLPAQMFVFGERAEGLAATDGLPLKADLLELPDELVTVFRTEGAFQQLVELYAVARACHSGDFPDFRRGELSWTAGNAKIRRQMLTMAVLTVVMILLLFVYKGLQYRNARTDLASLNSSIAAQYREIFPNRAKAVDEVAEVKGELRKLAGNESSSAVLDVLKKLAEAKGATINGLYEAEVEGRTVRVKGDARNSQAVNDFKSSLAGILSAIELGEIKSRPDGLVSFSLTGQIKEAK